MARTPPARSLPPRFPDDIGIALACPACRGPVVRCGESFLCRKSDCRRKYDIDEGIPRFLVSEAAVLPPAEWEQVLRNVR